MYSKHYVAAFLALIEALNRLSECDNDDGKKRGTRSMYVGILRGALNDAQSAISEIRAHLDSTYAPRLEETQVAHFPIRTLQIGTSVVIDVDTGNISITGDVSEASRELWRVIEASIKK